MIARGYDDHLGASDECQLGSDTHTERERRLQEDGYKISALLVPHSSYGLVTMAGERFGSREIV